jgi:hypothetical protein
MRRARVWWGLALPLGVALAVWALWPRAGAGPAPDIRELAEELPAQQIFASPAIASDDLPPAGTRSLFDHLVAENDGLPYPFEKLVALLQRQHPEGEAPPALMIPFGRSLLKGQADFERPRVLVAADFHTPNSGASLGPAPRAQLFLGFVENAAEIEVISYNEAAGRFEFQLVQDYRADGQPRIVYARRAICLTCHQGGGPIFPQRPWNETNGQPEIAERIQQARGGAPYLGAPALNPLGVPERYDELTDTGSFIPVTQRVWLEGCGSADCRRQLLRVALHYLWNPGAPVADTPAAQTLRALQAASWPAAGIAVPESDIRNRDPLAERRGLAGLVRTLFNPARGEPGARNNEDLAAFERLPKLPAELDPLSPRPPRRVLRAEDIDGAYGIASLFTAADQRLLENATGFRREKLDLAVDRLPETFFAARPFSRVLALQALLAALDQPVPGYAYLDTSQMSPPLLSSIPPLEISAGSPLRHFETYCFACHRGNPAARLNFMGGATEAEVLAQIRGTPSIRDALDWARYQGTDKAAQLMPPADSPQHQRLQAAIAAGDPALDEMRATVPGLFDF